MNRFRIFFIDVSVALLLVACGDDSSTETRVQDGTSIVDSADDLPDCEKENEGTQAYVRVDASFRFCVDGKWRIMARDTVYVDTKDFSCTTQALKDSSGIKIICNGDSIGVVLNGTQGQKGMAGEGCRFESRTDTSVTITCGDSSMTFSFGPSKIKDSNNVEPPLDSEAIAVSLDSLTGFTQKGPFIKGATVYLYELNNGYTLKQTNGNFVSNITRDDGRFKFTARDLVSQYVMLMVDGNYRNEVTGKVSDNPIQLKAISNMMMHKSANVNILTHLEFERVYHLVTKEHYTVLQAKRKAQKEILAVFNIELDGKTEAEDMDVFGNSDADAALLAVSILLQGDRSEFEMVALLTEISNDMAEKGEWVGKRADSIKAYMADWAFSQNLSKFRENVKDWHLNKNQEVGDFEKYINNFIAKTLEIKTCNGETDSLQHKVGNQKSRFYGRSYQCVEKMAGCEKCEMWVEKRKPNPYLNKDLKYGTMIDWRDRKMYYTIKINMAPKHSFVDSLRKGYSGIWMAENLSHEYRVAGEPYGNNCFEDNCDANPSFGRYYTWAAAMDSAALYSGEGKDCGFHATCGVSSRGVRGICPEGWHLPSSEEWENLVNYLYRKFSRDTADYVLKSKTGWEYCGDEEDVCRNGNDSLGFSAAPAGMCADKNNCSKPDTYFWTSTELDPQKASTVLLDEHNQGSENPNSIVNSSLALIDTMPKEKRLPIRCIQESTLFYLDFSED